MLNQEVHKNLRRNKTGIHVDRIEKPSQDYKRPPGFALLPTLLNASMQNKSLDKNERRQYSNVEPKQQQPQPQPQKFANKFVAAASKASAKPSAPISSPRLQIVSKNVASSKNELLRWEIVNYAHHFCYQVHNEHQQPEQMTFIAH